MFIGKLLKYDMKAMGRILFPMYAVLIVLSFITKISLGPERKFFSANVPLFVLFIMFLTAVSVATLIIIIQRFYKNLLCEEGYLMNTLPLKAWKNIAAKLISAFIWTAASFVVSLLSIFILVYEQGMVLGFLKLFNDIKPDYFNIIASSVLYAATKILENILMLYTSMAIGQLANVHKKSLSVAAFFGIYSVKTLTVDRLNVIILNNLLNGSWASMINFYLIGSLISIIMIAVYFVVTNYIIEKKLNLE